MTALTVQASGSTAFAAASVMASTVKQVQPMADAGIDSDITRLTLGAITADAVTYANPSQPPSSNGQTGRAWATAPQDAISQLMARNETMPSRGLADQWRGLGGALLARFQTTQSDYRQSVVDYYGSLPNMSLDPAAGTASWQAGMGVTQTSNTQALSAIRDSATQVTLKIQTRSGQSVTLVIGANSRNTSVMKGLHVEVQSSGTLSSAERAAIAQLADGLDKTLEGLGNPDVLQLDVSGLLAYDRSVLAKLDMSVVNRQGDVALKSFEFHADASRTSVSLQGWSGQLSLSVDHTSALGTGSADQRQEAIQAYLAQFDAAVQRSHGNTDLLAQFKDAFVQLHSAPVDATTRRAAVKLPAVLRDQVQPLLSGLADFKGSFGGDFAHQGPRGYTTEAGRMQYNIAQQTSVASSGAPNGTAISQTQTATLSAVYWQSRGGTMLDRSGGNYDQYTIEDSLIRSTQIETVKNLVLSAQQDILENQFLRFEKLENHRVTEKHDTPFSRNTSRKLR